MQTQERVIFCSTNFVSFFRNRFVVISAAQGHVWFPRISSLSTIVDAPMARFTVRRGRRRSGRTVSGALHSYAGDPAASGEFLSTVDVPMGRFTVRRKRRLSAAAFIGRRRPRDALHCTPGTEALCGGVHRSSAIPWCASLYAGGAGVLHRGAKILAFWRGSDAHGFYNLGNPLRSGACNP